MEKMLSKKTTIAFFILPGLLIFSIVYIFPMFYTLRLSVTNWEGIGPKVFVGFDNFVQLITKDNVFATGVKNVFIILGVALPAQLLPALLLALLLVHLKQGIRFYRNAFFIPVLMSASAIGIMWTQFYDVNHGAINDVLTFIGLGRLSTDWLTNEATCLTAVIIPPIWQWLGYHLIILYSGLRSIPEQYLEAAKLDGANTITTILHVKLPLMRDIIKVCVVLATVGSLKIFDNVYVMTGGGPYNLTTTIALQMYKESFLKMQFGYGSAIAVLLCIICIVTFWVVNKLMTREAIEY